LKWEEIDREVSAIVSLVKGSKEVVKE